MLKGNILVIDDEESLRKLLSRIISLEGYKVSEAGSVKEGLKFLDQHETALVISDVKLPDGNGVELTQTIKSKFPETEIIVLTAFGNIQDAVQTIKNGAYDYLVKAGVDALVIIGGDGSFTGAEVFNKEYGFPVMGIPGTIDNDIFGTSHTLGYDTALNTVVEVIDKIRDTAISHNRLFFVEVMGRDAGHIALNTGIGAGAEEILIPEEDLGLDRLLESLKKSKESGKSSSIVVVAEGDKIGKTVFELKDYVEENMPEYDVRVSVLGHMQRGGAPSCFDRVLASRLGVKAVESLLEGKSNFMVGLLNDKVALTPLEQAIKGHTEIDKELLRVSDIMST
ncbi:MAG: ATP-dependent 6-phosphofructokinase [Flavobacterium sp.]|nr:ATP-dependent 6-phosphofructokinase [Flavobacterium sp.]